MAKRHAYMIQETLHGMWYSEEGIDGSHWVDQKVATVWIGVENREAVYDVMANIMMGLNGYTRVNHVKVVKFDYAPPVPGEFSV